VKHFAAITDPIRLGELLRAIDGYSGEPATMIALKLTPHVFQRPGEVRSMRWAELDLENAINGALRRLGFTGSEMTAHGFRTTASSLLYESGKWNPDAIARTVAQRHECCSWNL
jgi:integrase